MQTIRDDQLYMNRAIMLAKLGAGYTLSNPMVGSVLVHNGRVIGEGYHRKFGEPHAEVNCINSVPAGDQQYIAASTIYVTLEPCAHFGKTPPCADLIIASGIKKAIIGCRDPFPLVNGKGIEKLNANGVETIVGICEEQCLQLNKRFFTFHQQHRPYIILKWAQTADHFIGNPGPERLMISNDYTNRLVHKWRSEEMGIMVGTNTALTDNPSLTNRLWSGPNPTRVVVDRQLKLPSHLAIFDQQSPTVVLNERKDEADGAIKYVKIPGGASSPEEGVANILRAIHGVPISSVIIEGGRQLLQSFIDSGYWDEANVITNQEHFADHGIKSPSLRHARLIDAQQIDNDLIQFFVNIQSQSL
jgi:diaminohydroxyphosphoribosylaminopyrimidine deaminase / 5-amino-6-(5-phosphoribosylamino)uracil reductase